MPDAAANGSGLENITDREDASVHDPTPPALDGWLDDLEPLRGRHLVYHLCAPLPGVDPEDDLAHVYVGVTSNLRQRLRSHSRKWWWPLIDLRLGELIEFVTRAEAEAAERELIQLYRPDINRAGLVVVTGGRRLP